MTNPIINEFARSWKFIRGMTHEFINCVPDHRWDYSPSETCSPLSKQFRHLVWVSGLYTASLKNRKTEISKKKSHYSGDLSRSELISGLKKADAELTEILNSLSNEDLSSFKVDHFGMQMSFSEFTHVMIQHESIHQGLWSMYARQGGFETPSSWKENWGL